MTGIEISLYVLIGLVLVFSIRRVLLTRLVTHYTPDEVTASQGTGVLQLHWLCANKVSTARI